MPAVDVAFGPRRTWLLMAAAMFSTARLVLLGALIKPERSELMVSLSMPSWLGENIVLMRADMPPQLLVLIVYRVLGDELVGFPAMTRSPRPFSLLDKFVTIADSEMAPMARLSFRVDTKWNTLSHQKTLHLMASTPVDSSWLLAKRNVLILDIPSVKLVALARLEIFGKRSTAVE